MCADAINLLADYPKTLQEMTHNHEICYDLWNLILISKDNSFKRKLLRN